MSAQHCKARRHVDQMQCARCGIAWDLDDAKQRPACLTTREIFARIRAILGVKPK